MADVVNLPVARPLIDLDLGHACQYGYHWPQVTVVCHDDVAEFDLRAARRRAGLSQATLGALLGVRHGMVWHWEHGRGPCPTEVRMRWLDLCQRRTRRASA